MNWNYIFKSHLNAQQTKTVVNKRMINPILSFSIHSEMNMSSWWCKWLPIYCVRYVFYDVHFLYCYCYCAFFISPQFFIRCINSLSHVFFNFCKWKTNKGTRWTYLTKKASVKKTLFMDLMIPFNAIPFDLQCETKKTNQCKLHNTQKIKTFRRQCMDLQLFLCKMTRLMLCTPAHFIRFVFFCILNEIQRQQTCIDSSFLCALAFFMRFVVSYTYRFQTKYIYFIHKSLFMIFRLLSYYLGVPVWVWVCIWLNFKLKAWAAFLSRFDYRLIIIISVLHDVGC